MALRSALHQADRDQGSHLINKSLSALDSYQKASTVCTYFALGSELDLTAFNRDVLAQAKVLVVPFFVDGAYVLSKVTRLDELVTNPHGVTQPRQLDPVSPEDIDFWVVPGLGFSHAGARLGRGGGHYDRLLVSTSAYLVGVGFKCQLLESIPLDPWDVCMSEVILV